MSAPRNDDGSRVPRNCGDCGAKPGAFHKPGCDMEKCARCGGQTISCGCIYEVCGIDQSTMEETHPEIWSGGPTEEMYAKWDATWGSRRMPWSGEYPGTAECREYGFWCVFGPEMNPPRQGWVRVPVGTEGATEDLNRLVSTCRWDVDRQKWVETS